MGDFESVAFRYANIFVQMCSMLNILSLKNNHHGCISPDIILITNSGRTLKLIDSFLIHPVLGHSTRFL